MAYVLKIKNEAGEWVSVPALLGPKGPPGDATLMEFTKVLTGEPGTEVTITEDEGSTAENRKYILTIPRGDVGLKGDDGDIGPEGSAGTITITRVITGLPGTDASIVEDEGSTDTNRKYVLTVPRGEVGQIDNVNAAGISTTDPVKTVQDYIDEFLEGGMGEPGEDGVRGSQIFTGTAITGEDTTGLIFSSSGIVEAIINDIYMNTSTWGIYKCVLGGNATTAKWAYLGTIEGKDGVAGVDGQDGLTTSVNDIEQVDGNIKLTSDDIPYITLDEDGEEVIKTVTEAIQEAGTGSGDMLIFNYGGSDENTVRNSDRVAGLQFVIDSEDDGLNIIYEV